MKTSGIADEPSPEATTTQLARRKAIVLLAAIHVGLAFTFLASKSPYQASGEERIGYPYPYRFIASRAGADETTWFTLFFVLDIAVSAICCLIMTVPVLASIRSVPASIAGRATVPPEPFGPVECGLIGLIAAFVWTVTDLVLYFWTEADHPESLRTLGLVCREGAIHIAVLVMTGAVVGIVVERTLSRSSTQV